MNKKGMGLINVPLGLIGFFILILVLVSLVPVQISDDYNVTLTIETLNNSQSKFVGQFAPNESQHPAIKVTYSFIGFIVYSSFEVTKLAVSWGSENIDIVNPRMLLNLVILCLIAPIIIVLFKLLIIIFILTKEYFQSKKEKKELKKCLKKKKS